jgi:hypothetical protein
MRPDAQVSQANSVTRPLLDQLLRAHETAQQTGVTPARSHDQTVKISDLATRSDTRHVQRARQLTSETASDLGQVLTFGVDLRFWGLIQGLPTG